MPAGAPRGNSLGFRVKYSRVTQVASGKEAQATAGDGYWIPASRAHIVVGFATAMMLFLTAALYALPAFGSTIKHDLSLDSTELGLLSSAFVISYALAQIPSGVLSGIFGLRAVFVGSLVTCGLGFIGSGIVHDYGLLLAFRGVCGAGAGMLFPVGSALARAATPTENLRSQGIFGSGWGLGFVFSLLALPLVFTSWRVAFDVLGAISIAFALYAALLLPCPPFTRASVRREVLSSLKQSGTWLLGLCFMGITIANVGVGAWATSLLEDHRDESHRTAALVSSLIGWGLVPATIVGTLFVRKIGGFTVVRLACALIAASLVILALPLPLAAFAVGLWLLGFGSGLPFGILLSLVPRIVRGPGGRSQATVVGAINTVAFVGGVIAPPLIGFIKDRGGGYGLGFVALLIGPAVTVIALERIAAGLRASPAVEAVGAEGV